MSDADVKAIALFFFFTMLDEKLALHSSAQAFEICSKKIKTNSKLNNSVQIVIATQAVWEMHRRRLLRGRPQYSLNSGWQVPQGVDFSGWKEFQKNTPEEELLALVWSQILQFSDEDIATGLEVTQGTVRFRVGRALRKLGTSNLVLAPPEKL